MRLPVFLAGICLLVAFTAPASAIEVPGISTSPVQAPLTESAEPVQCALTLDPYIVEHPDLGLPLPTASPPPPYFFANITMTVSNQGTDPVSEPWTLTLFGSSYSLVEPIYGAELLNLTQSVAYLTSSEDLQAYGANNASLEVYIQSKATAFYPTRAQLNGVNCSIVLTNNLTAIQAFANSGAIESAGISIDNGQLIGEDGNPLTMQCANYFGFNNGQTMLDGLYAGDSSLEMDYGEVLYRIQLLGFNCLRVPFSFQNLFEVAPRVFTKPCTAATPDEIQASVTDPSVSVPAGKTIPAQIFPTGTPAGQCNADLPNTSTYQRFLHVVQFMARNGFYVLIDNHFEDTTILTNPTQWVDDWSGLMADIVKDSVAAGRVLVDLYNEPDSHGLTWSTIGPLYLQAAAAIYGVSPGTLIMVEGCGQLGYPGINYGDGFVTDPALISEYGLSDPNSFFTSVLSSPFADNVLLGPHVYPPSITSATQNYQGTGLWQRMYDSFGNLNINGYQGHKFPVVLGETGSKFVASGDLQSMADISAWVAGKPDTGPAHNPANGVCYWSWNANSGDTGGLVDDAWTNIQWVKVQWMEGAVGLTPWFASSGSTTPASPVPSATPSSPSTSPSPSASPSTSPSPSASPPPSPSPSASPLPSPSPSPSASPSTPPSPSASPSTPPSPSSPSPSPSPASPSPEQPSPSPVPASPSPEQAPPSPSPSSPPPAQLPSTPQASPPPSPVPVPSPPTPQASPSTSPSPVPASPSPSPEASPSAPPSPAGSPSPINYNPPSPTSASTNYNPPAPTSASTNYNPPSPTSGSPNYNPPSPSSSPMSSNPPSPSSASPGSPVSPSSSGSAPPTSPDGSIESASPSPADGSTSCNVAFSFGDKYACGLGTCQVVNLAVSQLAPEDIDIPWMLLLAQNSWATDTYIHTWWNCDGVNLTGSTLALDSNAEWQHLFGNAANAVNIGYIMESPSTDGSVFLADSATLNGAACSITGA